jgi:RNA polymerase sigma-70 factor (ECF subfamily)
MISFEELYKRYSPDIFRFALYLCGNRSEAEDIVSEAFVRLWTAAEPPRTASVKAYLFVIARNLYLHERRSAARRTEMDDALPDCAAGPEGNAAQRQALRLVLDGLKQLPEVDRSALIMRAWNEMPYEEIAAVLHLPLATVKVKVHRARLKLAQMMEPPMRRTI